MYVAVDSRTDCFRQGRGASACFVLVCRATRHDTTRHDTGYGIFFLDYQMMSGKASYLLCMYFYVCTFTMYFMICIIQKNKKKTPPFATFWGGGGASLVNGCVYVVMAAGQPHSNAGNQEQKKKNIAKG